MTAANDTQRSPLRTMATIAGAMLITVGAVALATGELDIAGVWILAVGLAASGVAGLLYALTAAATSSKARPR